MHYKKLIYFGAVYLYFVPTQAYLWEIFHTNTLGVIFGAGLIAFGSSQQSLLLCHPDIEVYS